MILKTNFDEISMDWKIVSIWNGYAHNQLIVYDGFGSILDLKIGLVLQD
jgi:hypothetical protein